MGAIKALPLLLDTACVPSPQSPRYRLLPMPTNSECWESPTANSPIEWPSSPLSPNHFRHRSTSCMLDAFSPMATSKRTNAHVAPIDVKKANTPPTLAPQNRPMDLLTPPDTPEMHGPIEVAEELPIKFDFSKIDYSLEHAGVLGRGLWSTVYKARRVNKELQQSTDMITPPTTPRDPTHCVSNSVFAVKIMSRPDAQEVFEQEANILSKLRRSPLYDKYVVPFYGYDARNSALVFEAVEGGSLDVYTRRLNNMPARERKLHVSRNFPRITRSLIAGLDFLHWSSITHADIKPANILLNLDEDGEVELARFIDFSASFISGDSQTSQNAGGTWDFMAPEQISSRRDLKCPTEASDVWSLGITLLTLLLRESPYSFCAGNMFMLREAVKSGQVLEFASNCSNFGAVDSMFLECCGLALRKDRTARISGLAWKQWAGLTL